MIQMRKKQQLHALSFIACALLVAWSAATVASEEAVETTVIVVRHAEKALAPGNDPPLSEAGQKRADSLRHALEKAGVSAIYATEYQRTQKTVEPLAKALKLPVTRMDAANTKELVTKIRKQHGGETVLVAGHSNTVPEIIKALGAAEAPVLAENDYDNLFVLTVSKKGTAKLLHLRYGADGH